MEKKDKDTNGIEKNIIQLQMVYWVYGMLNGWNFCSASSSHFFFNKTLIVMEKMV